MIEATQTSRSIVVPTRKWRKKASERGTKITISPKVKVNGDDDDGKGRFFFLSLFSPARGQQQRRMADEHGPHLGDDLLLQLLDGVVLHEGAPLHQPEEREGIF